MITAGTYRYAKDIDVLRKFRQGLGDGHDIRVVTLLQGVGYEVLERFADGGKVMVGSGTVHHFAGAGKMMHQPIWTEALEHIAGAGKMVVS